MPCFGHFFKGEGLFTMLKSRQSGCVVPAHDAKASSAEKFKLTVIDPHLYCGLPRKWTCIICKKAVDLVRKEFNAVRKV